MQEFALAVTQGSGQSQSVVINHCRRASRRNEELLWYNGRSNMGWKEWNKLCVDVEEPGWGGHVAI